VRKLHRARTPGVEEPAPDARPCPHSRLSNASLALGVEIKDLSDGDIRAGFVS